MHEPIILMVSCVYAHLGCVGVYRHAANITTARLHTPKVAEGHVEPGRSNYIVALVALNRDIALEWFIAHHPAHNKSVS